MDRAEDAADGVSGLGIALQDHQVPVELVEVLVALEQELADDVVHGAGVRLVWVEGTPQVLVGVECGASDPPELLSFSADLPRTRAPNWWRFSAGFGVFR